LDATIVFRGPLMTSRKHNKLYGLPLKSMDQ